MSDIFGGFDALNIAAQAIALLVAIIGHEIMHGAAALRYGDTTARDQGRLSLNPIRHIDPIGTIALPLMLLLSGTGLLFGWAKPVPVDPRLVMRRGGHFGMLVVSLAGVAYNFVLAFVAGQFISPDTIAAFNDGGAIDAAPFFQQLCLYLVMWNIVLAIFNLLPIPPLDGSNAIAHLCAMFRVYSVGRFFNRIGMWGMIVLMAVLLTDLRIPIFWLMMKVINLMV